jgi:hypothetical protein
MSCPPVSAHRGVVAGEELAPLTPHEKTFGDEPLDIFAPLRFGVSADPELLLQQDIFE